MRKEIKVKLETLTPFWTGDVNGKCNKLKLTGIVGSLRWVMLVVRLVRKKSFHQI